MCFEVYQHFLILYHHDLSTHEYFDLLEKYITIFCNHTENEIFLHLTNIYLNVEFESKLSKSKEHRIASKDRAW